MARPVLPQWENAYEIGRVGRPKYLDAKGGPRPAEQGGANPSDKTHCIVAVCTGRVVGRRCDDRECQDIAARRPTLRIHGRAGARRPGQRNRRNATRSARRSRADPGPMRNLWRLRGIVADASGHDTAAGSAGIVASSALSASAARPSVSTPTSRPLARASSRFPSLNRIVLSRARLIPRRAA